ncbi:hypothetical protein OZ410_11625 [Robiginitalea sp. M366]|uniref:hypothetical protein n=1 Tax=Robiginitalea aestuariiviva TaxID=3036903 RepID=UPI00240E1BD6|nr:hypothetical protein [Robiginitalea aestuariiviva]MDG1572968.1 hypothetical protein [Robiginitalea aestuariiviva]
MSDYPVLWIIACAVLSLGWAVFQYYYKSKPQPRRPLLALLRFFAIFGLLLLLVNPSLVQNAAHIEKHRLYILLDNSSSVDSGQARIAMEEGLVFFRSDTELRERFSLLPYRFGQGIAQGDSLDFSDPQTDITGALRQTYAAAATQPSAVVLLSDGNQSAGAGYAYAIQNGVPVYPVVVGDTAVYRDLRLDQLNINRYAFKGNRFPVELLLSYTGTDPAKTELVVRDNDRVVYRETLEFRAGGQALRRNLTLEAGAVGFHGISVSITPLEAERNTRNNQLLSGLEVIDEQVDVRLVSTLNHPDIGALKRSITANEQRTFRVQKPEEALESLEGADLLIFFQPNPDFNALMQALPGRRIPVWTLTGPDTDWDFLNGAQQTFEMVSPGPDELIFPEPDRAFDYFDAGEWQVSDYPPLEGVLGEVRILPEHQTLLGQTVKGISLGEPLLALVKAEPREAVTLGAGLWQWRMADFRETGNFEAFDAVVGKMIRFLTAEGSASRLTLDYRAIYEQGGQATLKARYFDETFAFDPNARLVLKIGGAQGGAQDLYPMGLRSGYFEADLSGLSPGEYSFIVEEEDSGLSRSGRFRITAVDAEGRRFSADLASLRQLAVGSGGALYYPDKLEELKDYLLQAPEFRPVRKNERIVVSLIDFKWLLALVLASLGTEWFLRKYNGIL